MSVESKSFVITHALQVLEFPRVLELVAARATSELGAGRIRALAPSTDHEWVEREHSRVAAMRAFVAADTPWHPEPLPDLVAALGRLRVAGLAWSAAELLAVVVLLRSSRRTLEALRDEE